MAIESIPIRAIIGFEETGITVSTPYISSFSVTKSRGQASTASVSMKVDAALVENMKGKIHIIAGPRDNMIRVFTGYVKTTTPSPCWDDPAFFMVNLSIVDELFKLESRKFTRRQLDSDTSWAIINDVISQGTTYAKVKYAHNAPLVLVSDKEILKELANNDAETEKTDQSPKLAVNSPKQSVKTNQRLEAKIGYVSLTKTDTNK